MVSKYFQLYRWYKPDGSTLNHEYDLSILRVGKYWLLNFNMYKTTIPRSVGANANFGVSWPLGDLFTLNLYLYNKDCSFSLLQRDYDRLWDDDIDWGEPCNLTIDEGT